MAQFRRVVPCVLVALACLGSCSDGEDDPFESLRERPNDPTVDPLNLETELPDTRGVDLVGVSGYPSGPIEIAVRGGDATLEGTVTGPDGPVGAARVRLERFVGEQSGSLDVVTRPDGTWRAADIHGGRYRIRAWQAPRLGMTESRVLFIHADEATPLDMELVVHEGADLQAVASIPSVSVGGSVTITALVTRKTVDGQGILRTVPSEGSEATARAPGGWSLEGPPERRAAADGRVSWRLTCAEPGSDVVDLAAAGVSATVSIGCTRNAPPPPPPTPPPTTSFAVGEDFTPPFVGPIPAGSYEVTDHTGTCGLVYQPWVNGAWSPQSRTVTGTGTIQLPTIARNLRTVGGTPPCTYERIS